MRQFVMAMSTILMLAASENALALPELDLVKSIDVDGRQLQYMPDSADPNAFYFLPDNMEIVPDTAGNPKFGFQHWGITKKDPAGIGGNFTFTVRPSWDNDLVSKATEKLRAQTQNPSASLAVVPIEKSYFDVVMTNSFAADTTYVT